MTAQHTPDKHDIAYVVTGNEGSEDEERELCELTDAQSKQSDRIRRMGF